MTDRNINGLKVHKIIARGKRSRESGSVDLGLRANRKIVRMKTIIKEKYYIRTKEIVSVFMQLIPINCIRNELFVLFITFLQTVFAVFPIPWAEL